MNHSPKFFAYLWSHRRHRFSLLGSALFLIVLAALLLWHPQLPPSLKDSYGDYLAPGLAIGTLLVAAALWVHGLVLDFRSNWPRKLHVVYARYNAETEGWEPHAQILNAPLTSPADARPWAQSMAKTVLAAGHIDFSGFLAVPARELKTEGKIVHYFLIFLKTPNWL